MENNEAEVKYPSMGNESKIPLDHPEVRYFSLNLVLQTEILSQNCMNSLDTKSPRRMVNDICILYEEQKGGRRERERKRERENEREKERDRGKVQTIKRGRERDRLKRDTDLV
ncbi:hypothetical protein AAMO2058_000102100 [Amorphochlora amoebiformis]